MWLALGAVLLPCKLEGMRAYRESTIIRVDSAEANEQVDCRFAQFLHTGLASSHYSNLRTRSGMASYDKSRDVLAFIFRSCTDGSHFEFSNESVWLT